MSQKLVNGVLVDLTPQELQQAAQDALNAPLLLLPRQVLKSLIISRITDEQLDLALATMTPRQKERWRAPDVPTVAFDDAEVVGLIQFIGADPDVVLAP